MPCEMSLNVASFETLGSYMSGALVVTRVPREVIKTGPTGRVVKTHRRFGHFLGSRTDWCGAYVLSEEKDFKRNSGLRWDVLAKFQGLNGRKCQLLRWTPGRIF